MKRGGCVYIMTNNTNRVLYTGVTSELLCRVQEHKTKKYPKSFTSKYNAVKLVYYEVFNSIEEAISREKQIKAGSRAKKVALIGQMNSEWNDLYEEIKKW